MGHLPTDQSVMLGGKTFSSDASRSGRTSPPSITLTTARVGWNCSAQHDQAHGVQEDEWNGKRLHNRTKRELSGSESRRIFKPLSPEALNDFEVLEWSAGDQQTGCRTRLRLPLTHEGIGECIAASRETVTRALNDFKQRHLVELHGSTLKIPNREALEHYARRGRRRGFISHPAKSTVSARAAAWIGSSRSSDLTRGRKIEQLKNG